MRAIQASHIPTDAVLRCPRSACTFLDDRTVHLPRILLEFRTTAQPHEPNRDEVQVLSHHRGKLMSVMFC